MAQVVQRMRQVGPPAPARDAFDHFAPRRLVASMLKSARARSAASGLANVGRLELLEGDLHGPWPAAQAAVEDGENGDAIDVPQMLVARAIRLHQPREMLEPLDRGKATASAPRLVSACASISPTPTATQAESCIVHGD